MIISAGYRAVSGFVLCDPVIPALAIPFDNCNILAYGYTLLRKPGKYSQCLVGADEYSPVGTEKTAIIERILIRPYRKKVRWRSKKRSIYDTPRKALHASYSISDRDRGLRMLIDAFQLFTARCCYPILFDMSLREAAFPTRFVSVSPIFFAIMRPKRSEARAIAFLTKLIRVS